MESAAADPAVRTEQRGAVLLIVIDRPAARNAVDGEGAHAIAAAMDRLEQDADLHIGILWGANGHFSAGADLKRAAGRTRGWPERGPFGLCRLPPAKPLIAAVEGVAFGGGMEMALACDLIVAARDARFALPEVRRGIVASGGGAIRLARRLPYHLAVEMALTGSPRDAEWCHAHGLVNRLSEPGHALQTALELADELLCNGPLALAATVAIMRTAAAQGENAAWTQQDEILAPVRASRDREEGIAAFLERRAPRWTGR